jgi:hypothetical protein
LLERQCSPLPLTDWRGLMYFRFVALMALRLSHYLVRLSDRAAIYLSLSEQSHHSEQDGLLWIW